MSGQTVAPLALAGLSRRDLSRAVMIAAAAGSGQTTAWRGFALTLALVAFVATAALYGFVLAADPYGRRVRPGRPPAPLMDVNQRFMYPQLAKSGLFDSAVFGTSTVRLLDPARLDKAVGGRFANLALNAGTPWEQLQLAGLFARHVKPRTLILGLDRAWCDPDADADGKRLTFRAFPPWLYDEDALDDLPHLLNLKSLEIAWRVLLNRLGLMRPKISPDGYDVFTPPEPSYDLARALTHLGPREVDLPPSDIEPAGSAGSDPAELRLPAVEWLADFVRTLPAETRIVALLPPLHIRGQPAPGSRGAMADAACKRRIVRALGGHRAALVDYRWPSRLTERDENFWDKLHYRVPVATGIVDDLADVVAGRERPDAPYRVLLAGE